MTVGLLAHLGVVFTTPKVLTGSQFHPLIHTLSNFAPKTSSHISHRAVLITGLLKAQVSPYSHICLQALLLGALELACAEVTKESGNK